MSTINLLPDDYLKKRSQRRSNIVCMALFAVVITAVIGANAVTSRSENLTLEVQKRVNEEYARATEHIQHKQALEMRKAVMLQKAELTASLAERMPRSTVLGIVATACPKGVSFDELTLLCKPRPVKSPPSSKSRRRQKTTLSTKSRKTAAPPPVDVSMTISGLAETDTQVARFIANLASNRPLIQDVNLVFSQEKRAGLDPKDPKNKGVIIREFEVRLRLDPEVDALKMVKSIMDDAKESKDIEAIRAESQETVG